MVRFATVLIMTLAVTVTDPPPVHLSHGVAKTADYQTTTSFDDSDWELVYQENFDTDFSAQHGLTFGTDNWLIFQLIDGGAITVANGYAQLDAPDFWNAALIRSTVSMPPEFKVRTKIGYLNYDLTNYEQADYDDPNFNTHAGHYENGMYFLTLTDDTCAGSVCAEDWWHQHRKMVIDVDNHINWSGGGETFHPVYMVYMSPETGPGGNLLRTWDGVAWDDSENNWNVAHTYEYDTWYYAEVEKKDSTLVLRLYDGDKNIIEETTPVDLNLVFAMDDTTEYLYLGEPHTDDYEGNVRIDEITLLIPDVGVAVEDDAEHTSATPDFVQSTNYPNPFNNSTIIEYNLPERADVSVIIYDLLGRRVKQLFDGDQSAGSHQVVWDGADSRGAPVSSGVYFYRIEANGFAESKKMLLLK